MLLPISPDEEAALHHEFQETLGPPLPLPEPRGFEQALTLVEPGLLRYRRRTFVVPPVSYRTGLTLMGLRHRWQQAREKIPAQEALVEAAVALSHAVRVMHQSVRPYTLWDRLTWRWRANPFEDAEFHEMQALLDFFCAARTTCPVMGASTVRADFPWRTVSGPTWPDSLRLFPRGATGPGPKQATRSAGGTTLSVVRGSSASRRGRVSGSRAHSPAAG